MFTVTTEPATDFLHHTADSTPLTLNSVDMHIGSRVRIRRTSRGVSEQELSKLLGIERSNLAAYETGEQRITASLLFRIAKVLDVRADYFFRGYKGEDSQTA